MHKIIFFLNNDHGSITVIALLILSLLTVIGFSALNTANTELKIAQNDSLYRKNFFKAEGAAIEAAQRIENEKLTPENLAATEDGWIQESGFEIENTTVMETVSAAASVGDDATYAAISRGIASGSSLVMTEASSLHEFAVHGLYNNPYKGVVHIEIGYKTRF